MTGSLTKRSLFTKRHYEALATFMGDTLREDNNELQSTLDRLCRLLARDNNAFDSKKFRAWVKKQAGPSKTDWDGWL